MKKLFTTASLTAIFIVNPAFALQHQITPLPPSDYTCGNLKGTWQFKANWEPLFDARQPPDPITKKRPLLIDSATGKPWATYQVTTKLAAGSKAPMACTLPDKGLVNCGGATKCGVLLVCPSGATGALVAVQGVGVVSSTVRTKAGIRPANCK